MEGRFRETLEAMRRHYVDAHGVLEQVLMAFALRGHVLIEGPPGTGKTSLAKLVARTLSKSFRRIQFTADLLPQDICGAHLFDGKDFKFIAGPIFADLILADELNRASPRAQSGLLEAMEERQVTIEGVTRPLPEDFFVLATQNPHDHEGTFALPEAQLDRFMVSIALGHGAPAVDREILDRALAAAPADPVPPAPPWAEIRAGIDAVAFDPALRDFVARILARFRSHDAIEYGPSVRAGIALARLARAKAWFAGRAFATADDVKAAVPPVLSHRVRLSARATMQERAKAEVIPSVLDEVAFPV